MADELTVLIGESVAGTLTRARGGRLRFVYDAGFAADVTATPLSVSMPLAVPSHDDRAVTPWLWGLLPDNAAVLARWSRQFQVSAGSPFTLLSTPIGADCAGAARFVTHDAGRSAAFRGGEVEWLTEGDVAATLRLLRDDTTAWLGRTFGGQFSLAGAQAKTALYRHGGRWGSPRGATPTTHILKPAIAGLDDHDLNEHLCLAAARRTGLPAARSDVVTFGEQRALVVERYDRVVAVDGTVQRIHQEDVCQALLVHPSRKYQTDGGPAVADIAALLRRVLPPPTADASVWRFADALIWNWLIAGTDAHAKNFALLLAGADVRLAPLYDLASALPYGDHERTLRLAMKVGGSYDVCPTPNVWPRAAADLGLPPDAVVERVRELAAQAPEAFAATAATVPFASPLPARLADLVADRAARCLRTVADVRR